MTRLIALVTAAFAAIVVSALAGCSSSSAPAKAGGGKPVYGGTLRIVANGGPGSLDPVPAYIFADYEVEHAYARQLLSYRTRS